MILKTKIFITNSTMSHIPVQQICQNLVALTSFTSLVMLCLDFLHISKDPSNLHNDDALRLSTLANQTCFSCGKDWEL